MRSAAITTLGAIFVWITGCAVHDAFDVPRDVPPGLDNDAMGGSSSGPNRDWYREFASPELDSMVQLALQGNWDIEGARARVLQADARARQAGAALLPSIDAAGNANYLAGHSSQGGGHELDWSAMLTASYEIDFWGKNRDTAHAARYRAAAARAERETVGLTTLAAVADQYFKLLALRERLAIAKSNSGAAAQLLELTQARFDAGVAAPVELAAQRAEVDSAQIAVSDLEQNEQEARDALAVLIGRAPEHFEVHAEDLSALVEPGIAAGLPSELLTRRPDIALAEANLRAAHADLAAARAAMFPSLSLTAGAGVQNPALPATVLTIPGVGPSFLLGANLVQPIFDHGRLRAQRDEVQAREIELLAAYRASIVASLVDVENALAGIQHLNDSRESAADRLAQSERAFEGAKLRYQAGSGDFLTMLEAQKSLYATRDLFVQYRLARLQSRINLFKALGGGYGSDGPGTASVSQNIN